MDRSELVKRFSHHRLTREQEIRCERIREWALNFALLLAELTPVSREQSLAITALEECVSRAVDAIAHTEAAPATQALQIVAPPTTPPVVGDWIENRVKRACGHNENVYVRPHNYIKEEIERLQKELVLACQLACTECIRKERQAQP